MLLSAALTISVLFSNLYLSGLRDDRCYKRKGGKEGEKDIEGGTKKSISYQPPCWYAICI